MPKNASTVSSEKPLHGVVLCCTAISPEQRTLLAEYAEQMGAEHRLDLTSDITHLIIGSTDTEKYQYVARERPDIRVIQPEWIEAVRQCWMQDRLLDLDALEEQYKVPVFDKLKICITGFNDLTFRAQLHENIDQNGGKYTGDLTRDCTHLIAYQPTGKKYEYATIWQKNVVSLQWYQDSLARGMRLDETAYHPSRPAAEQGVGAWNRQAKRPARSNKRSMEEQTAQEPTRKIRRTASAKFSSQSSTMWDDIVGGGDAILPPPVATTDRDVLRPSKSMSAIQANAVQREDSTSTSNRPPSATSQRTAARPDGRFLTSTFLVIDMFDAKKKSIIQNALIGYGACVLNTLADMFAHDAANSSNSFLIVPYQTRQSALPYLGKNTVNPSVVTELWLEKCLAARSLIHKSEYPLAGLTKETTSPEVQNLVVNATGFESIETLHIAKSVGLVGAKYEETFTPKSTVLVCNSKNLNQQKVFHAQQWQVPAVSEEWLWCFLSSGTIPSFDRYLIGKSVSDGHDDEDDLEKQLATKRRGNRAQKQRPDDAGRKHEFQAQGDGFTVDGDSQQQISEVGPPSGELGIERAVSRERESLGQKNDSQRQSLIEQPLKEISPNSPTKSRQFQPPSPKPKKSLLNTLGKASTTNRMEDLGNEQETNIQDLNQSGRSSPIKNMNKSDPSILNSAIQDLLNLKAKAKEKKDEADAQQARKKTKRLLGRALSNLSNSSRQSRASSVDSLNTDGVGTEVPPLSANSAAYHRHHSLSRNNTIDESVRENTKSDSRAYSTVPQSRGAEDGTAAQSKMNTVNSKHPSTTITSIATGPNGVLINLNDDPTLHLLRDDDLYAAAQQQIAPPLTQLYYEDNEEAQKLRAQLAEKKRAKNRGSGQVDGNNDNDQPESEKLKSKEKKVIKDDDVLVAAEQAAGWGTGRRTRTRARGKSFFGEE